MIFIVILSNFSAIWWNYGGNLVHLYKKLAGERVESRNLNSWGVTHVSDETGASQENRSLSDIDDVLSLNNYKFGDFVDHIYPIELEIKDTTDLLDIQWRPIKNETLRQQRIFQFSHSELSIIWLTVKEYLCHTWWRICIVCRNYNPALS